MAAELLVKTYIFLKIKNRGAKPPLASTIFKLTVIRSFFQSCIKNGACNEFHQNCLRDKRPRRILSPKFPRNHTWPGRVALRMQNNGGKYIIFDTQQTRFNLIPHGRHATLNMHNL